MLVLHIVRWLSGYVSFSAVGTQAHRFLTSASVKGFQLWNMEMEDEQHCTAYITAKHYRQLRMVAKKKRLLLHIENRYGLPFLIRKWKKSGKHGFFLGLACSLVLLSVLSGRVWVINVSGNNDLSAVEIKASAAEFGLDIGTGRSDYNPISIENQLMLRYPELSWVSVNDWGNTVEIAVQEGERIPDVEEQEGTGNVIAAQSGQIISMDVYHGKAMVKIGDGVAPGQLLVTGIWEHENGNVSFARADAKIMARTRRQFRVTVPMEETMREENGNSIERKSLRLFGVTIPLTFHGVPNGIYEKETEGESLQVNGVELPLTISREIYREQREYTVSVSEEEARKRGEEELHKLQEEALKNEAENGTVLSEHITIKRENAQYVLESDCLCLENIAQRQQFEVEIEEPLSGESSEAAENE